MVKKGRAKESNVVDGDVDELITQVITILEDQDEEQMYASEIKDTLTRLRPDFSERSYGCATFGKLMSMLAEKSPKLHVWTEQSSLMVGLSTNDAPQNPKLDKNNWLPAFTQALERFKNDGFDRVQPLHPQGHHTGRLSGLRRKADRLQALQRRDEGAGKAKAAGGGNGRGAHDAFENLLNFARLPFAWAAALFLEARMKISVGKQRPAHFRPAYPEEFDLFSHLELCAAVPQALFAITTWKENGLPTSVRTPGRASTATRTAFFAVMGNLYQHTHTYRNIVRDGCFCINFLSLKHYEAMMRAIRENGDDTDEFAAAGLTRERCEEINARPSARVFSPWSAGLLEARDLSGEGVAAMVTGEVVRVCVEGRLRARGEGPLRRGRLFAARPGAAEHGKRRALPHRHRQLTPRLWD